MNINIEKNINTEQQKSSFKYLSPENIKLQRTYDLFPYYIGYGENDYSLTSFCSVFSLSAGTGSYGGIQRKFYENQSITSDGDYGKIIPSAYINNNIGSVSANVILTFLIKNVLYKDGISNINPEKNIFMKFSAVVYDISISSTIVWGSNSDENMYYILYDKKISSTAGNIVMQILTPDANSQLTLSGSSTGTLINRSDLIVGKIFYDYGLVVIDSFQDKQIIKWGLSGNEYYYYFPYPTSNGSVDLINDINFNLTAGTIPTINDDFSGVYFNSIAKSVSGYFESIYSPTSTLLLDKIEFTSKLNKNSYILEIPILQKEFNYSTNRLRVGIENNIIPEATEENPIWFNKIGLYDYKNNLLGVARLNIPIKNSNKRTMIIKIRADY